MLIGTSCGLIVLLAVAAQAAERPRIVGIANFAVKVDNLEEARKFYSGVVGMEEAFQTRDAGGCRRSRLLQGQRPSVRGSLPHSQERDRRPAHPDRLRNRRCPQTARLPGQQGGQGAVQSGQGSERQPELRGAGSGRPHRAIRAVSAGLHPQPQFRQALIRQRAFPTTCCTRAFA